MPHPAVLSRAEKICVIAAPGSGKSTSIIIPKAVALIDEDDVVPGAILLMSFSRLSALDLKQKVGAAVQEAPPASTVHSYALRFLISENNHGIRNRVESILLDFQKAVMISDIGRTLAGIDRRQLKKHLDAFAAGWAVTPEAQLFDASDGERRFKAAVIGWLAEHEAAMMEEIMHHAVDLARQLPDAQFLAAAEHLMVDEYQDLNRVEQEFIGILSANAESTLIVGDPDQSIYGFKFAYPNGIRDYYAQADVERYESLTTYRCPRSVVEAANSLLVQAEPGRANLVAAHVGAVAGEVHFIRRDTQDEEFAYVARAIADRPAAGVQPSNILVLAPRRKLAALFTEYVEANRAQLGVADGVRFATAQKDELTATEYERLLLLGLITAPRSLLNIRTYLGFGDDTHYRDELADLKARYGDLRQVVADADPAHFPRSPRRRALCHRAVELRNFLQAHQDPNAVDAALDELLPANDATERLRSVFDELREPGDTLPELLRKHLDYRRALPEDPSTVRAMTLMASKGLGAAHVFIIACNAGNMPGTNRNAHMTDQQHRLEQLRMLYVGFTRATQSLTVSWSRRIPFEQARGLQTPTVRIRRVNGQVFGEVGLCEFLQNIPNIRWE